MLYPSSRGAEADLNVSRTLWLVLTTLKTKYWAPISADCNYFIYYPFPVFGNINTHKSVRENGGLDENIAHFYYIYMSPLPNVPQGVLERTYLVSGSYTLYQRITDRTLVLVTSNYSHIFTRRPISSLPLMLLGMHINGIEAITIYICHHRKRYR